MNTPDFIPPLDTIDAIVSHLEVSLASKKLTIPQQLQMLRELMASELGVNPLFHEACQKIVSRLTRESFDLPTVSISNARSVLSHPNVLLRLRTHSLQDVVGGDIAFRVSCIEELVRKHQTEILFKQVAHLNHWKEGQAMIQALVYAATPDQLFHVLMECIYNRFSNNGENHFGPNIYREESIDVLFSATVSRSSTPALYQIASEFAKGAAAIGLPPEQFDRYNSLITVRLMAVQMKDELSGLIDVSAPPQEHPESSAFFVEEVAPPREEITGVGRVSSLPSFTLPSVASPSSIINSPTRVLRMPTFAPAVPPPSQRRSVDDEGDSAAFGVEND